MNRVCTAKPRTVIQVVVSERLKEYLRDAAAREGRSVSDLVRGIIEKAVKMDG